jgi:hypothetical protein
MLPCINYQLAYLGLQFSPSGQYLLVQERTPGDVTGGSSNRDGYVGDVASSPITYLTEWAGDVWSLPTFSNWR